jgi:hypothetical protein
MTITTSRVERFDANGRPEWDPFEVTDVDRAEHEAVVADLSAHPHVFHHVKFGADETDDYDRKSAPEDLFTPEQLAILKDPPTKPHDEAFLKFCTARQCKPGPDSIDMVAAIAALNALPHEQEWTGNSVSDALAVIRGRIRREVGLHQGNCISSKVADTDDTHTVAVDIDHRVLVVETTTPSHHHLYIDVPMPWVAYCNLLKAMSEAGIIEPGYYAAAVRREATHLRLPWVRKEPVVPAVAG